MIFVIVGTSSWNFTRLIEEMDRIAGEISEEVIIQIANNTYIPKKAKYFKFISSDEMEKLYKNAKVVVSHAGVGTIISALKYDKKIIIVPRREKYGEHFDDHQVDIAKALEQEGLIKVVWDTAELKNAINSLDEEYIVKRDKSLIFMLKKYINELV